MAKGSFKATLAASGAASALGMADVCGTVDAAVQAIVYTTVAANIATLVADGATPTQAHVTTLNTNWNALKALIDTATAASTTGVAASTAAAMLTVDLATFPDSGKLNVALQAIIQAAIAGGTVTR